MVIWVMPGAPDILTDMQFVPVEALESVADLVAGYNDSYCPYGNIGCEGNYLCYYCEEDSFYRGRDIWERYAG